MAKMIMAAFNNPEAADHALYDLEQLGYTAQDVSIISKNAKYTQPSTESASDVPASAAAGATTGGVIGLPRDTATAYDEAVAGGGAVLGLACPADRLAETRAVLERCHAQHISELDARDQTSAAEARNDYVPSHAEAAFGEHIAPHSTRDSRDVEEI